MGGGGGVDGEIFFPFLHRTEKQEWFTVVHVEQGMGNKVWEYDSCVRKNRKASVTDQNLKTAKNGISSINSISVYF